jgi:hypothetical protein
MPFSYVTTGQITFNMTEPKRAVWVDHFHTGIGTFNIYLAVNTGDFTLVGTHVVEEVDEQMPSFALGDVEGKGFNFLIQLVPDTDPTQGLTFKSYTLRAQPRPNVTNIIYATFLLGPAQVSLEDSPIYYDVHDELDFIENKHAQKMVETLTLGRRAYEVTLEDYDYLAHSILREWEGLRGIEGSILCKFKRLDPVGFPVE